MNRLFIGLFILLAVPRAAFAAETYTIRMTDSGFEPTEISIKAGDTVNFLNNGTREHWPASNIHPTHGVYPGSGIEKCGTSEEQDIFDACRGVSPGDRYSFVFTHAGEWRFHDHIEPAHGGLIQVMGESDAVAASKPSFVTRARAYISSLIRRMYWALVPGSAASAVSQLDIFELVKNQSALENDVRDFGGKALMLRLIEQSNGGSSRDCHQEAHKLGRAAYEVQGKQAFKEGDSSCHSGFYHGAMEEFLRERGTNDLAASIKDVCDAFTTSFSRFECLHGVGHGLLAYVDYDLPAALHSCTDLSDQFSVSSCFGGVFMENIVTAQGIGAVGAHSTSWVRRDDPQFPCTAVTNDPNALYQCYLMQTSWMLTISNYDFGWTAKQCLNAPQSMVQTCYQSLGRDIAGFTLRDPEKIVTLCSYVPKKERSRCIVGAVNVIIDFWGEKLTDQASALCRIAPDGKNECFSMLASRIPELFPDAEGRSRVCATLDPEYRERCR